MQRSMHVASAVAAVTLMMLVAAAPRAQETGTPPAMSAEEQAMMQKWQVFMTPGSEHALLATKAGSWTATVTMWSAEGAPPQVTTGTSEMVMILGGRYLQDTTNSNFNGMPFEGHGLTAYDNLKKKFVSTWIDNMGTGIMTSEGTYDAATKTFTYLGTSPDPMTGKYVPMKGVEIMRSASQWTSEMYNKTKDGKGWWKSMQIDYTRKP
jgi:hypothetical protein